MKAKTNTTITHIHPPDQVRDVLVHTLKGFVEATQNLNVVLAEFIVQILQFLL